MTLMPLTILTGGSDVLQLPEGMWMDSVDPILRGVPTDESCFDGCNYYVDACNDAGCTGCHLYIHASEAMPKVREARGGLGALFHFVVVFCVFFYFLFFWAAFCCAVRHLGRFFSRPHQSTPPSLLPSRSDSPSSTTGWTRGFLSGMTTPHQWSGCQS